MDPDSGGAPLLATRYLDEDVSYLEAGACILALAEDEVLPAGRRTRLLAKAGRALDDFFVYRGAALRATAAAGPHRIRVVRARAEQLIARQGRLGWRLAALLDLQGGGARHWDSLTAVEQAALAEAFSERLRPALAPMCIEPGCPLPPPASLSLNLAVRLSDGEGGRCFGSVELPPALDRFIPIPPGRSMVPVEQIVEAVLPELFPGYAVEGSALYRLTRAAGDDGGGTPSRLEVEPRMGEAMLGRLLNEFDLGPNDVYRVPGLLAPRQLEALAGPLPPRPTRSHVGRDSPDHPVDALESGDRLVRVHPGGDGASVAEFLGLAARDQRVLVIKQTLLAPHPAHPVVKALSRAAERGTGVVALVDLAGRHPREAAATARILEKAGAHVVGGLAGLRTHCSVSLVVRGGGAPGAPSGISRYVLVDTAPHNQSRCWEALGFVSRDPMLAADFADLFNHLTGYSRPAGFRTLAVGPAGLRRRLLALIREQASMGQAGRIGLKVARLVDRETIDALYDASRRGTRVEVVASGACALRPGVTGLSEGIRVVASAGELTDTSRYFGFGVGAAQRWFLTSADLAPRNLDRQVEVAVPVADPTCARQLGEMFDAALGEAAWVLGPDGAWRREVKLDPICEATPRPRRLARGFPGTVR